MSKQTRILAVTAVVSVLTAAVVALAISGASAEQQPWTAPAPIDRGKPLTSVSCVSASFCVAVDGSGEALTFDGASWGAPAPIDNGLYLNSVSCASASFCVAVDTSGNALTFDGASWSAPAPIDNGGSIGNLHDASVSCPSVSFCMAVVDAENTYVNSGYAVAYNGSSWGTPVSLGGNGYLTSVSCASASFCVAVGDDSLTSSGTYGSYAVAFNGSSWGSSDMSIGNGYVGSVSCVSASFCVAVGEEENGAGANTVTSGAGGYDGYAVTYDGSAWGTPSSVDSGSDLSSVSCVSVSSCVAVDSSGNALTYLGSPAGNSSATGGGASFPSCSTIALLPNLAFTPVQLSAPVFDYSPLPLQVVANAKIPTASVCDQGEAIRTPPVPTASAEYVLYPPDPQTGSGTFQFDFDASAWRGARRQDPPEFDVGNVQFQPDFSPLGVGVDSAGNVEIPLAKLTAKPQNAVLIENPASSQYFAITIQEVGELAAKLKPDDLKRFFEFNFKLAPSPIVAVYVTAAAVSGELLGGVSRLGPSFPGLDIDPALPNYYPTLIDAFGSDLFGIANLSNPPQDHTDGPPILPIILGAGGFLIYHAAGAIGGTFVCGPACTVAGAVAATVRRARASGLAGGGSFVRLDASRARIGRGRALRIAPFPRSAVGRLLGETFRLPVSMRIGPLITDTRTLRPGGRVTVAVGQLANRAPHRIALFVLGPDYRGRRLLDARRGVAGATIALPRHLRPGKWVIATEDLSSVRLTKAKQLSGQADDRIGVFTVSAPRVHARAR